MAIFDVHHPLILVFGILGNIVSTGVYFAPMPTFVEICKRESTMGFESLPYVVALFSALLWTYYALIKEGNTFLLITINALGSLIEFVYVIIFILYATPHGKKQTYKIVSGSMVLLVVICVGCLVLLEGRSRALVVGWICVGVSVCVFAAPLTIVYQVVKTKSVQFMPFPLSCFLTLSAVMWFAYGMLSKDLCVTVPNVLGFVLGVIQMGLYKYYKHKSKKLLEINLKIVSELHPAEIMDSRREAAQIKDEEEIKMKGSEDDDELCVVEVEIHNVKPLLIVCAA